MDFKTIIQIELLKLKDYRFFIGVGLFVVLACFFMLLNFAGNSEAVNQASVISKTIALKKSLSGALVSIVIMYISMFIFIIRTGREMKKQVLSTFLSNGYSRNDILLSKVVTILLYIVIFELLRFIICIVYAIIYYKVSLIDIFGVLRLDWFVNEWAAAFLLYSLVFFFLIITRNAAISIVVFIVIIFAEQILKHKLNFEYSELLLPFTFLETRMFVPGFSWATILGYSFWCLGALSASWFAFNKRDI